MGQTPSNRRREGRNAFDPTLDPESTCRYKDPGKKEDWMDGWNKAKNDCEMEQLVAEAEDELFERHRWQCPWNSGEGCEASVDGCSKDNCAPWYFKNVEE